MAYLGNSLTVQQYAPTISYLSGNGSTTAFTLPIAVASAAQIIVTVENVIQNPAFAFSVSGTTLTFTSAPPSGTNNIWVEYTALQTNTIAPSQGTVQDSSFGSITKIPFVSGASIGAGDASIMKNRIINGAMGINQRGFSGTPANGQYTLDRYNVLMPVASKFTVAQSSTAPTGFVNSLLVTSSSAYTVGASEAFGIQQVIEGYNIADLGWGTASAKTVTLSFWVYSSLTGTFGGALQNYAADRSYPFSYTVSSANTWTQASVTIAGDTTGTWTTTNSGGIALIFSMGTGSTKSGTAGVWGSTYYTSVTGATSVVGTNGATFYITGVQLEVGSSATGFEYRQYGQELSLCQRYFSALGAGASGYIYTSTAADIAVQFPVTMRSTPSVSHLANYSIVCVATGSYTVTGTVINPSVSGVNTTGCAIRITSSGMSTGNAWLTNGNNVGFSAEL